jgi:Xaa-Pro aminopeptidase
VSERLQRLAGRLEEPLLVTAPVNVRYLVGFDSSNAALLVERDRVRLYTDFRYVEAARSVADVEVVQTRRDVYGALGDSLEGRVGFEAAHVTYARWQALDRSGAELAPTTGVVEALRAVKDAGELEKLRRASAVATRALERLVEQQPWSGRTERELARQLERLMREEGADEIAFATIVAGGPNGALPHAHPGETKLAPGMLVTIDFGARVDDYCSDCTRTFAIGEVDAKLREIYDVCLRTQVESLSAVQAGMPGRDVDLVAREHIDAHGYGDAFGHGLGHGVGMEVHEAPTMRPESDDTLEPGNVVSVEPGIYLPGLGGVRIEDLVVVTDGEPEVLTHFPKELRVLE